MKKIFLSHCEKDKEEVRKFYDLLCMGMGFEKKEIFYSSEDNNLPTGEPFMEVIKEKLTECEKIFCYITPNYLNSIFCITEMAAAWLEGKAIPIISHPRSYDILNDTPLMGTQASLYDDEEDLGKLYGVLCKSGIVEAEINTFNRRLKIYFEEIKKKPLIEKDSDNFYTARIEQVRNVPYTYRCYKIQGTLKLDEELAENESHWIFFRAGMYSDLKIGDTVRFSIGSTELRRFGDIGLARNIYPDELQVI